MEIKIFLDCPATTKIYKSTQEIFFMCQIIISQILKFSLSERFLLLHDDTDAYFLFLVQKDFYILFRPFFAFFFSSLIRFWNLSRTSFRSFREYLFTIVIYTKRFTKNIFISFYTISYYQIFKKIHECLRTEDPGGKIARNYSKITRTVLNKMFFVSKIFSKNCPEYIRIENK